MNFNDFTPGQTLTLGPVSLSEAEIIDFARLWDPQPFHTDPQWAANSRWKGLIASGWQTCALTMRTVCEGPLRDSGSIGSPSSGKVGKLRWQWRVHNQHGALVLDTIATVLFDLAAE